MTSLLLDRCRLVVTMDDAGRELPDTSIAVRDGWITHLGKTPPAEEYDETIDCSRFLAIPGLINTHHHLYQTLTRGFPESRGQTLFPWLRMLYPIWAGLDTDMIYASTRTGLAELALSGCTTSSDHHYVFPAGSESFMDASIEGARSIGVRFHATRGSMDLGESGGGLPPDSVTQSIDTILEDCERVIGRYHDPKPGATVQVALAPCSPFSVSPELMRESASLARRHGVRLHTHIAETKDEEEYSLREFGTTPVGLLDSLDWLGHDVWLAHCVHPSDADLRALGAHSAAVAHCPTSNMLLGSGLAPVRRFIDSGVPVGLGVDGSASNDGNDLRYEVKQAVLAARIRDGVHALPVRDALRLATRGGAQCLGRNDIGSLEERKAADIVLFHTDDIGFSGGEEDLVAMMVLGSVRPHTVIVGGRVIVRAGQLQTVDTESLAREQRRAAARLSARAEKR